jgi:chromosome partitioning protein
MADLIPVLKCDRQFVALQDLLQVVGVSRQYSCVRIESRDGGVLGSIWIKSGFVVGADAGELSGRPALFHLLAEEASTSFSVFRLRQGPAEYPEPLGSIAELMLAAVEEPGPPAAYIAPAEVPARGLIVGFASAKGGVGKTTLALNVALAFAEMGQPVLLVDTDPLGGIGHSLAGHETRSSQGIYDVLLGRRQAKDVILPTKVPALEILPAGELKSQEALEQVQRLTDPAAWEELLAPLADVSRLVIVDLPAGLYGIPSAVLGACTHALVILEAEPLALRAVPRLVQSLREQDPRRTPTALAGIILNGVQFRTGASISVVQGAWTSFAQGLVLETTVPRDTAFLEASEAGVPVAFLDRTKRPPVAAVFRHLADDIAERIGLYDVTAAGEPLRLL